MKEKVRVFLSFEFGRDNELHYNFYSQAALYSQYEIIDYSLNEPYYPDPLWLNKARKQIALSDIVIVMVGQDTHNATGVEKEVILKRQREETAELAIEDTVRHLLIQGESGFRLIQQGYSRHIVDRMVVEMKEELERLRKDGEKQLRSIARRMYDNGNGASLRTIQQELNISYHKVKALVKN